MDGFLQGMTWGIPKMFGFEPSKSAQESMMKAPVASELGELLSGAVIPYAGWYKASTKIPRLVKLVEKAGELGGAKNPFLRGAAQEAVRFAPLELGRIGTAGAMEITGAFGDINFSEVVTSAAFNLALEGATGGVIKKIATSGKARMRTSEMIGQSAEEDPIQIQMRSLDNEILNVPPEKAPQYAARLRALDLAAREERPVADEFIDTLVAGQDRDTINKIYAGKHGDISAHRLHIPKNKTPSQPFHTDRDWANLLGEVGIDANMFSRFAITPRFVKTRTALAAERTAVDIRKNMTDIGDGWWKADEAQDGFTILAREIKEPRARAPMGGWLMLKTDMPDWFRPGVAGRVNRALEENAWVRRNYKLSGGGDELGAMAIDLYQRLPFRLMQVIRQSGATFDNVAKIGGSTKWQKAMNPIKQNAAIRVATDFVKRSLTPTRFQGLKNPRFNMIFEYASAVKEAANNKAKEALYGKFKPVNKSTTPTGDNLFLQMNRVTEGGAHENNGPINALLALSEQEWKDVWNLVQRNKKLTPELIRDARAQDVINDKQADFLHKAEIMRQYYLKQTEANMKKFGAIPRPYQIHPSPAFITKVEDLTKAKAPSKNDFRVTMERTVHRWAGNLANNINDNLWTGERRLLELEDPVMGKILEERMNDLADKLRPFAAAVDRNLAPMLGGAKASDISKGINRVMHSLTLAGINSGYLIMNPIGGFINVVPRAMMVINGRGVDLGDTMRSWPTEAGIVSLPDGIRAWRQAVKDIHAPDAMMQEIFDRAAKEGKLTLSLVAEEVGAGSPSAKNIRQLWNDGAYLPALDNTWNYLGARSEQYGRLMALVASTRLARNAGLTNPDDIYRVAVKVMDDSMYGYRQADKAAFMTGPVGGPLGLFKNWTINQVGDTLQYMGAAVRGNWRPLLWQQVSATAIAGVSGSTVGGIAATFYNMFSDDDLVTNMFDMFGDEAATGMAFGLPAYLGFSLTPSGSAPGANPTKDIMNFMEPVMWDRIKAIHQLGATSWNHYALTGNHPADSPDVRRLIFEAVAPRTIMRVAQQFLAEEAIASSKTSYPLIKEPTLGERFMYMAGLSTDQIQKQTYATDILYRNKERRKALTAGYGEAIKDAIESGDRVAHWRLFKQAARDGLDIGSVARSAASRLKQGDMDTLERAANPVERRRIMNSFGLKD